MRRSGVRIPRRFRPASGPGAALLLLLALPAAAAASAPQLSLRDGGGTIEVLELGRSLWIELHHLTPSTDYTARLETGDGLYEIVSRSFRSDEAGALEPLLLWEHTGVVGCDCASAVAAFRFARFEDAESVLLGRALAVEVRDEVGALIAARDFRVIASLDPLGYPGEASGCPRFRFSDPEDIYLFVRGGHPGTKAWAYLQPREDEPLEEDPSSPPGDVFELTPPLTRWTLWLGEESSPGNSSFLTKLIEWPDDVELSSSYDMINPGLVILDHSCPSPPKKEP